MKKVLVFRHIAHEGLGTLEEFLNHANFEIQYLDLFKNSPIPKDPSRYDFIITMGGPMNVDETDRYPFLKAERAFIQEAIRHEKPILGICLGAQMIARALNVRVYAGLQKEIGWFPIRLSKEGLRDPVLGRLGEESPVVFHWHGDTFELPAGAVHLASSDLCANQAFRFGSSVYAFQFHIEMTSEMVIDWLAKGTEELKTAKPPISGQLIIQDIPKYASALTQTAEKVYEGLFSGRTFESVRN